MSVVRGRRSRRMNRWEPSPQKKPAKKRKQSAAAKAKAKKGRDKSQRINALRALPYQEYLETAHWKRTRDAALKHHGERCQKCGTGRELQVHHVSYNRRGSEKMVDLAVLCGGCHAEAHGIDGCGELDRQFAAFARTL